MISKKKMRERIIDICAGAGLNWQEGDDYFDDFCLEYLGNAIRAIEIQFGLGENTRIRYPWNLKKFDDVDDIVELVRDCIQFDL